MCVAGISGQRNSIRLHRNLSTPACSAHTQAHITHPSADTHMSPQQPNTAKDKILKEKQGPPYRQASSQHGGYGGQLNHGIQIVQQYS